MNGFELLKKVDIDGAAHLLCYWNPFCANCPARNLCMVTKTEKNGFHYLLEKEIPDEQCESFLASAADREIRKNGAWKE